MIRTRLPVLGAIALIVATIFNCGVAVAGPNQTSADYVMPGCRDAASLITFSNAGESEEQVSLMGFCAGIVVGLSFMGQPYGICVPAGTTSQQATSIVVQYIDGQPARINEDFNAFAVEALRAHWPCSLAAERPSSITIAPLECRDRMWSGRGLILCVRLAEAAEPARGVHALFKCYEAAICAAADRATAIKRAPRIVLGFA